MRFDTTINVLFNQEAKSQQANKCDHQAITLLDFQRLKTIMKVNA